MEETEKQTEVEEVKVVKEKSNNWVVGLVLLVFVGAFVAPKLFESKGIVKEDVVKEEVKENVGQIVIEAGSFYFKPNLIQVKKGEKIKVVLSAVSMMHNFYLDEFSVKSDTIKSGESTSFEFTADKVGEFEFYCGVGQHRANGQVGKLIVTE